MEFGDRPLRSQVVTGTGARFSACRRYRYLLWRRWRVGPAMLWLMLNPSTADETTNDPTVERCQRRTVAAGYGALLVCNIFALRTTDPRALYDADDPVGRRNDAVILAQIRRAERVICGWGNHGRLRGRGRQVLGMLRERGAGPWCLGVTRFGEPQHPLYVPYAVMPTAMRLTGLRRLQ